MATKKAETKTKKTVKSTSAKRSTAATSPEPVTANDRNALLKLI